MEKDYKSRVGKLIQTRRQDINMTQKQLAEALETSQSAINRIEKGNQNISLEMLARISEVLSTDIISFNNNKKANYRINGGLKLTGAIDIKTSKNAAVALLCASLLNLGKTTFHHVARIEEVHRIIEVLTSIGVQVKWLNDKGDLQIIRPRRLRLNNMDEVAAKKTRSIIMFLGPLLHQYNEFQIPFAGGCTLGTRTIEPHLLGLMPFGMHIQAHKEKYHVTVDKQQVTEDIVLIERGNTTTENILMAAAQYDGTVTLKNASNDYMVIDLCHFLVKLGVKIKGIGTTALEITGRPEINENVEFTPSEDPIEAMTFLAAGIVTGSEITVRRVPIDYMEIELAILKNMGLKYNLSKPYKSYNGIIRLVDIEIMKSCLGAPKDKLTTFPSSVNMDNLPFLGLVATAARGRTLLHDWPYENRAIYLVDLTKLGARVELLDPHRVYIVGPTKWRAADMVAPPALRPSVVVMLAMLAAPGESILRDVYNIKRGYEDFAERLNSLGADIQTIS